MNSCPMSSFADAVVDVDPGGLWRARGHSRPIDPTVHAPMAPTAALAQSTAASATSSRYRGRATITAPPAAFVSKPSGQKTASGFECPEPQPKLPVTSKALNLFVWSEYIPQDMLDCFEKVYGITINKSVFCIQRRDVCQVGAGQFGIRSG